MLKIAVCDNETLALHLETVDLRFPSDHLVPLTSWR